MKKLGKLFSEQKAQVRATLSQFFLDQSDLVHLSIWILSFVVLMAKPWESTLQAMDSAIHARLALEVTKNGLIPALPMPNFNLDSSGPIFNDHPFTLFYLVGHFMRRFGADAWGARFIPSLFGVFSIGLLFRLGKKYFSPTVGWVAAVIFLTTPLWIQFSARFQLDPAMVFFIIASFYFWMGRPTLTNALCAGLATGLAVAFKSPVGFLILPSAAIVEVIFQKNLKRDFIKRFALLLVCSFLAPLIVWGITAQVGGEALVIDYLKRQVLGTAVQGRSYIQEYDPFYFIGVLWNSYRIWSIVFLICLWNLPYQKTRLKDRNFQIVLVGAFIVVAIISLMRFKFPHYYLPVFPFFALIISVLAERFVMQAELKLQRAIIAIALLAPVVLLIFPISTAPESLGSAQSSRLDAPPALLSFRF